MIPEVAEELATVIRGVVPANVVVLDHVPKDPVSPGIWIEWPTLVDLTSGTLAGRRNATLAVRFSVGLGDGRAAQLALGALMHGTVLDALRDHHPTSFAHLQLLRIGEPVLLGADHLSAPLDLTLLY